MISYPTPGAKRLLLRLKYCRNLRLEFLQYILKFFKLQLCVCARVPHLIHRLQHTAHNRRKVCLIEPYWRDDKSNPEDQFKNSAEKRPSAHAVEHFVIFLHETIYLLLRLVVIGLHVTWDNISRVLPTEPLLPVSWPAEKKEQCQRCPYICPAFYKVPDGVANERQNMHKCGPGCPDYRPKQNYTNRFKQHNQQMSSKPTARSCEAKPTSQRQSIILAIFLSLQCKYTMAENVPKMAIRKTHSMIFGLFIYRSLYYI